MSADPVPSDGPASRDREATTRRLLDAARRLLAEGGSAALGVNAVARHAGCDKQLIYRYFGGLDGLIDAVGEDLGALWADRLGSEPSDAAPQSYADLLARLATRLIRVLRTEPLLRKIALWELTEGSERVQRLGSSRSRALGAWVEKARGDLRPPDGIDAPATNAILIAAVTQLVLAGDAAGRFAGLELRSDEDWVRLERAVTTLVTGIYSA